MIKWFAYKSHRTEIQMYKVEELLGHTVFAKSQLLIESGQLDEYWYAESLPFSVFIALTRLTQSVFA